MSNRSGIIHQFDAGSLVAASILLLIICLGPMYFGSVLPRERAALQIGAFMALAAVVAGRNIFSPLATGTMFRLPPSGGTGAELDRVARPALAVAAVGVFGWLQSLPWPSSVTSLLAPRIDDIWSSSAARTSVEAAPMSLAPEVSQATGVHWLAVAACLAAASVVGRERRLRRLLAIGLFTAAVFEIVYGSDNWFAQRTTIWGVTVGGDPTRLRGTFVNPDHLAFFLTTACAGGFGWLWWSVRQVLRRGAVARRLFLAMLPSLLFLLLFVGLAFTGSRAGLAAMTLALVTQSMMLALHYRRWRMGVVSGGALVLGVAGIAVFGLQQGLGRFIATSAYEVTWNSRRMVYEAGWELWTQFPYTGTGLGTFRQAFPLVQPADLNLAWMHAHSDVLELLVTTGIIGPTLIAFGLVALYRRLWSVFQEGRRSEDRAIGLGALGALTGALIHSTVDFGLTIPANAFSLAIFAGLACGTATGRRRRGLHSASRRGGRPENLTQREETDSEETSSQTTRPRPAPAVASGRRRGRHGSPLP